MRTYWLTGIVVLALSGAGCGGVATLAYPTQTLGGERDVTFTGGGVHLDGREGGDVSRVVVASSDGYAIRADADGRLAVARAEARLIEARAAVTEARASRVDDVLGEVAGCQRRGYDLRTCVGDVATLYVLTAEQQDALWAFYGFGGFGAGGIIPSATGDTVAGTSATAVTGLREEVSSLAGDVDTLARALGEYAVTADGGAR